MVVAIIWKFMESFENVKKQHGVLVVEGSNPSVPTNKINELRINIFAVKILGYTLGYT